jgi:hypothetical protein
VHEQLYCRARHAQLSFFRRRHLRYATPVDIISVALAVCGTFRPQGSHGPLAGSAFTIFRSARTGDFVGGPDVAISPTGGAPLANSARSAPIM